MASRNRLSPHRLERLAQLAGLPPDAILPTKDAADYWGVSVSTWERMRAAGLTPPAVHVTARLLGYRKGRLDEHRDARTEPEAA